SGVTYRAVGFPVEKYEAALRSGRHRLLITLYPLVERGAGRDHGALIRGDRRRKGIERYPLAGKCLLESSDVARNRLQPADGLGGRHVHFRSGSQRPLGLVFQGSGPTVPEIRLAISDIDNSRGVPAEPAAHVAEALGQSVAPTECRVVTGGTGDDTRSGQARIEKQLLAQGNLLRCGGIGFGNRDFRGSLEVGQESV